VDVVRTTHSKLRYLKRGFIFVGGGEDTIANFVIERRKFMSRSLIQVVNQTVQAIPAVAVGTTPVILNLGTATHGYGCNARLSGNAVRIDGQGYYKVDAAVTVSPTAAGSVVVALYDGNNQIDGAIATATVTTANNTITIPINTTIKQGCSCDGAGSLTLRVIDGVASNITNISMRVEKS
jgi:hypothetical protein